MYSQEFELDGKMKRLKYDFNALADAEEVSGMGLFNMLSQDKIGFNTIRLLMWAGLKHEDRGITTERAGMIIKAMMGEGHDLDSIMNLILSALNKSGLFPVDIGEETDENPTLPEKSGKQSAKQ
jgi:hypothetical protein